MINTWFISDTHFGHKNILEYEKDARPFNSVEEMNETIIDRWNGVVGYNDIVYHLGDFCFGRGNIHIAGRLRGKKKLIMGNHDTYPSTDYLVYFEKLYGAVFWKQCILTHVPVHPNNLGARAFLNVHGHLHSKRVYEHSASVLPFEDKNYFNVSCEQNNLTPIHADVILERVKRISE
jgi:calcineurin-like phosphoesterase family protein